MTANIIEAGERDRLLGMMFANAAAECPPPVTAESVWDHPSLQNLQSGDHERALHAALDRGLIKLGPKATSIVVNLARLENL